MNRTVVPDGLYRHFKGGLYEVHELAKHTEQDEVLVIYSSVSNNLWYARPVEMFLSEVDRIAYPHADQKYRFELVTNIEKNINGDD